MFFCATAPLRENEKLKIQFNTKTHSLLSVVKLAN